MATKKVRPAVKTKSGAQYIPESPRLLSVAIRVGILEWMDNPRGVLNRKRRKR